MCVCVCVCVCGEGGGGGGARELFWISNQNDFRYFLSTDHPKSYQVSSQSAFWFRRRHSKQIKFQNGHHGCHLGYLNGMILAIFDQQVTLILPIKFPVNLACWFRRRSSLDIQDGLNGSHLVFLIGRILAIFDLNVTMILHTKF